MASDRPQTPKKFSNMSYFEQATKIWKDRVSAINGKISILNAASIKTLEGGIQYMHTKATISPFILFFLVNLIAAATRGFLYWDLTKENFDFGSFDISLVELGIIEDFEILASFCSGFISGALHVVAIATGTNQTKAFDEAKKQFTQNIFDFLSKINKQAWAAYVNGFLKELMCCVYDCGAAKLMVGLSSVNGRFVYILKGYIDGNEAEAIKILQHEMVHSFCRYCWLQEQMDETEAAETISPKQCPGAKYKKTPIHLGYLWDHFYFSLNLDVFPNNEHISPFSLNTRHAIKK